MTTAPDSGNRDALITGDELERMPEHELTELIDGRIVPLSPTNHEHGRLEFKVGTLLNSIVSTQNLAHHGRRSWNLYQIKSRSGSRRRRRLHLARPVRSAHEDARFSRCRTRAR